MDATPTDEQHPTGGRTGGRGVVITGGASGIGRAVADACSARGDRVVLFDIDGAAAATASAEVGGAGGFACDVADPDAVEAAATTAQEALGALDLSIDLVVNAAGVIGRPRAAVKASIAEQRWVLDVNVLGTIAVAGAFGRVLVGQDHPGHLVLFGSEHSLGVPHHGAAVYTASKHAVLGYADVLRRELPDHVHVSVVCPGIVATTLWRASERRQDAYGGATQAPAGTEAMMARGMPPEQVAHSILRGVDAQEFLIVTHAHVLGLAEDRFATIRAAFSRQLPDGDDGRYDMSTIMAGPG